MQKYKNILVSILLATSLSLFMGNGIVLYYGHITNEIENTHNGEGFQYLSCSESSSEEEISFYSSNIVVYIFSGSNSYSSRGCLLTPLPFFSIWLPPDNS